MCKPNQEIEVGIPSIILIHPYPYSVQLTWQPLYAIIDEDVVIESVLLYCNADAFIQFMPKIRVLRYNTICIPYIRMISQRPAIHLILQ